MENTIGSEQAAVARVEMGTPPVVVKTEATPAISASSEAIVGVDVLNESSPIAIPEPSAPIIDTTSLEQRVAEVNAAVDARENGEAPASSGGETVVPNGATEGAPNVDTNVAGENPAQADTTTNAVSAEGSKTATSAEENSTTQTSEEDQTKSDTRKDNATEESESPVSPDDERIKVIQDEIKNGSDINAGELNKLLTRKDNVQKFEKRLEKARQDLREGKPISTADELALERRARETMGIPEPEIPIIFPVLESQGLRVEESLSTNIHELGNLLSTRPDVITVIISAAQAEKDSSVQKVLLQLATELLKLLKSSIAATTEANTGQTATTETSATEDKPVQKEAEQSKTEVKQPATTANEARNGQVS